MAGTRGTSQLPASGLLHRSTTRRFAMFQSRRDFLKVSDAGVAALSRGTYLFGSPVAPNGEIDVRLTAGTARFAPQASIKWQSQSGVSGDSIRLDPSKTYQEVLGVGAALTEAACYMFNQLTPQVREHLFHELYHPSQVRFLVCRTCIGSTDYPTFAYSYDDGDVDPELLRFSIDHERAYVLPTLLLARQMNPELYMFAAQWSPPGWMKSNGARLAGTRRKHYLRCYAKYLAKYWQAYAP